MLNPDTVALAARLLSACSARGLSLVTAESCTGGLIGAALTAVPGSSAVVEGGFIAYANEAKSRMLGVDPRLIAAHGAVSEEVARAMAAGALAASGADLAVACTGIAGPGGGSAAKPVGLVHIAAARRGGVMLHRAEVFPGDRAAVRAATVDAALALLLALLDREGASAGT
ncbi:MAG: nicotinamide-nucleotide amidohydrolase family protein [Rhodovarius sp.]|nr:CinA family protein [Rhodovarius sp.]MCX7930929.1 CinA family protein [Rhodovarius sp.]MDW8315957.1 nicotinamide-nucleotide amidohydrolase family protein [Rhodovarius sp.]